MALKISFLGAAETVTGSRYLVESANARVLVDCGLFQGLKRLRERNWATPRFDVATLDAVVLTHAHIDHSGYLPRLASMGFSGPMYCTEGTQALLRILLPDSGYLHEEEARRANRKGYSKHRPARPLYTRQDAQDCLGNLVAQPYYEAFDVAPGVSVRFTRAGHIVGSASVQLRADTRTITFTGDVGRPNDPIMQPPDPLPASDYLVTESTYGDRRHPKEPVDDILERIVRDTLERGGVLLVPAFAVGRAQHLLYFLTLLKNTRRIPDVPVFLDSPMAIDATDLFCDHSVDHKLSREACELMCATVQYTQTAAESKAIDSQDPGSRIVISASGMATGGRILHHLKRFLPDERSTVLFTGFQAAGTRGRSLIDGTGEVKLLGQYVTVRAQVRLLEGLSAHADYKEMIDWIRRGSPRPRRVFVTHGEPAAADAFRRRLRDAFGWDVVVPSDGECFELE